MKKFLVATSLSIMLAACGGGVSMSDKVIARSDDVSSRPSWAKESTPLTKKGSDLYFLGQSRIPAEKANVSMGYRIAENNAKNAIAAAIHQNLTYMFQNAEEGTSYDASQVQFVSTESAKALMSKVTVSDRYWEKVLSSVNAYNDKEMFYSIYTRVKINENDMKKAIDNTLNKAKGISSDFKKKADEQWDSMVKEQYKVVSE